MVLLNYQLFIRQKISQQLQSFQDSLTVTACKSDTFHSFLVKLYQYCQEINIIQQRMKILADQTDKIRGMQPKLLQSQKIKVAQKIKEIGAIYSVFLMKQKKFKVLSDQAVFYQQIYKIIVHVMEKCFSKTNFQYLQKQINRLIRTNTFNHKLCWNKFIDFSKQNPQSTPKQRLKCQSNYKQFRRSILSQKSQIKPYVNNKSCFRSKFTRSPIITLLYPNNQFLQFDLRKKQRKKMFS